MPENEIENEKQKQVPPPAKEEGIDTFLKAAKEVKEGMVSKEDFEKLKEENKKLTQFIVEGGDNPVDEKIEKRSKAELLKVLENEDTNNLDYTKAALELRDLVMDEGGADPFLPKSSQNPITTVDIEGAERVAKVLKECVEEADGDPETFNFLFGKRVNDSSPILNAKVKAMTKRGK